MSTSRIDHLQGFSRLFQKCLKLHGAVFHSDDFVTAAKLLKNPSLLMHKAQPSSAITAYDGFFGAVIDQGHHFVITPYMDVVYEPLLGPQKLIKHNDEYFGPHDYLLWPQPFVPDLCHLSCIPRLKSKPHPPLLWWTPQSEDIIFETARNVIAPLGKLLSEKFLSLRAAIREMQEPVTEFIISHPNATETNVAQTLSSNISRLLQRVESQSAMFQNIRTTVKMVQRLHLELIGLIHYCTIYKPRIAEHASGVSTISPPPTNTLVGAFVDSILHAELLFKAGIPFWFVLPVSALMRVRVDQVSYVLGVHIFETAPSKPLIWEGPSIDTVAVHHAILAASGCFNGAGPVFKAAVAPTPLKSVTKQTKRHSVQPYTKAISSKQPGPKKETNQLSNLGGERDKFQHLQSPLLPPSNDVWQNTLLTVNRSQTPTTKRGGYLFPEAVLVITPKTLEKSLVFLTSWLRIRNALIDCRAASTTSNDFVSNQDWRDLLSLPLSQPGTRSSASSSRSKMLAILSMTEEELRAPGGQAVWRGTQITLSSSSNIRLIQEIVWELNELNFRFELLTLDAELNVTPTGNFRGVQHCFPATDVPHNLSSISFSKAHTGLAAVTPRGRSPYLFALRDLMSTWKGIERSQLLPQVHHSTDSEFDELEKKVASTYLNIFYKTFGRPATLPHRLDAVVD